MHKVLSTLRQQARDRCNDTALIDGQNTVSYQKLDAMVDSVASAVRDFPDVIALLAPNGVHWVAGWLGLARAGKTIVALPPFFSTQQLTHILHDSSAGHVLTTDSHKPLMDLFGLPVSLLGSLIQDKQGGVGDDLADQSGHIVYTSGTTGAPKGVRLGAKQIDWSAGALNQAVGAGPNDHYLSVLPFPLLLEQICGICVPLLAGAPVTIAADVASALMAGNPSVLVEAVERARPSITILVPDFLTAWVAALQARGTRVPDTLRYVAVGGAPVAPALARQAHQLGIPVHEGYGLSECCSVVAVNRPGERLAQSVGKPLAGLNVSIIDGEIVVTGPSVMEGYLNGEDISGSWKTGDLGRIDAEGNLEVLGRKDRLLVLSNGRNVNPEWVEALVQADPKILRCSATGHGERHVCVEIHPSNIGQDWFATANEEQIADLIAGLCSDAPAYARPGSFSIVNQQNLASTG